MKSDTCSVEPFEASNLVCNVPVENGIIQNHGTCELSRSNETIETMYCFNGYLYIRYIQQQGILNSLTVFVNQRI